MHLVNLDKDDGRALHAVIGFDADSGELVVVALTPTNASAASHCIGQRVRRSYPNASLMRRC